MKRKNLGILSVTFLAFSTMAAIVFAAKGQSANKVEAATPAPGIDLTILGDGIEELENAGKQWDLASAISMDEVSPGKYTKTIYSTGGQIIITQRGSWTTNRFIFTNVENCDLITNQVIKDYSTVDTGNTDHNIWLAGHWGYYRFTVDTNKTEKEVKVEKIGYGNGPTIAGTGMSPNTAWNCDSMENIFDTDDGIIYTKKVTTVFEEGKDSWRVVKYKADWQTLANYNSLDANSPKGDEFTNGGPNDYNFKNTKADDYLLKYNDNSKKITIYEPGQVYKVTYMEGTDRLGTDIGAKNANYTPLTVYKSSDANKRFVKWYTDASLETEYVPAALAADLTLYGKFENHSEKYYFAPGRDYTWAGVNIYAWNNLLGDFPGKNMTYEGGGIYSYTFVGELRPEEMTFKFSDTSDENHNVDAIQYPSDKNLYIYQADSYQGLTNNMIAAEKFAETFLNDTAAGCSAKSFTSETWATVKEHADEFTDDQEVLDTILANQGVYKVAELENDYLDEALRRYDDILSKYEVENFLNANLGNKKVLFTPEKVLEGNFPMLIVIIATAAALGAISLGFSISKGKKHE